MSLNLRGYFQTLSSALNAVDLAEVDKATSILDSAYHSENMIFIIGNGQSATTANAFALDLAKQTSPPPGSPHFRTLSLSANVAALTAWGNDVGFETIFTEQLKSVFRGGDVLVAVSASGNSPNIIAACKWVNDAGGHVIGLTGFDGGRLRSLAHACILVPIDDYGHVETAHIAIMHYWVDLFRMQLSG